MGNDTSVQGDYQGGVSTDAAQNAGKQAAQSGQGLAPQQPNESAEAYELRQAAYNAEKNKTGQQ